MNAASKLFVISAPSGAGKTTLVKSLIKGNENIKCSTSYTTRSPRINEKEGEDYFFVSKEKFEALIEKHTKEGDLVVDTFLGGGTTALACMKTKRKFKGCDIDEKYVSTVKTILQTNS